MRTLVDTSVLIDSLRGLEAATRALVWVGRSGSLHASEITRVEVLAGMRPGEDQPTRAMLSLFTFHELDEAVAELAGELGRTWLASHGGIDTADLVIAATARTLGADLLTRNTKHFPMFPNLQPPY